MKLSRRAFLLQAAAVAVKPLWAQNKEPPKMDLPLRAIDAHTHFYDPTRPEGVPWPTKGTSLYRPVLPKNFLEVAAPHGVRETVVVEASAWLEDNQWILDLAAQNACIVGFIGHLLPHETDFPKHVQRFAKNPIFRGVRLNWNDFLDHDDKTEFQKGIKMMSDLGLTLEINGNEKLHPRATQLAQEFPDLTIAINHVGGAGDAAKISDEWRNGMKKLGEHPNVFCKVSALMEQTDASNRGPVFAPRDVEYYRPILDHCWHCFGENRLIYGSNWPVCEKGGSYADQFHIVNTYFGGKGKNAHENYFWRNAKKSYRLKA